MGTVGLAFGSATSGAGFDVQSTVTSILSIQQGMEAPWKNQLRLLSSQDTVLSSMGTDLATLSTRLNALTAIDGVMYEKEGSSSNTNVVALSSADSSATSGSHQVVVSQLAQTSSAYSSPMSASDALSGSLSLQIGSGSTQTITIDATNNTLSTLVAAINGGSYGVTASVVSDASGSRLLLTSSTPGAAGQITTGGSLSDATTSSAMTMQAAQVGQDAQFSVDGIPLTSNTNTVSTAIPGVTFQLLSTSSAPVQVAIVNNTTDIAAAIAGFASAYNQVISDMQGQEGKDASGAPQPLYGSPLLAQIQMALSGALMGGAASGVVTSMQQIGLSVNQDGTLTFSQSDLESSLNQHFSDVVGFLQNSGSFGQNFASTLDGLSSTDTRGALYLFKQQNTTEEAALNKNISDEEDRLATQKTELTKQLSLADQILQQIPSQLNEVNEMYSAVTGYNSKG